MLKNLKYKLHKAARKTTGQPAQGELLALARKKHFYLNDIDVLVQRGSNINEADARGFTALMISAAAGSVNAVHRLIHLNADIHRKDIYQRTAFMWAARNNRTDVMRLLWAQGGIDLEQKDENGDTVLVQAMRTGHLEAFNLALNLGASIEMSGPKGVLEIAKELRNQHMNSSDDVYWRYHKIAMAVVRLHRANTKNFLRESNKNLKLQ